MPAAAVIPAPRAYINVVAVKKPVVGFEGMVCRFHLLTREGRKVIDVTPCSETCGNVHWPKGPLLDLEATSESLYSSRCARRRHCE